MAKILSRADGIGIIDNKFIKARGKERRQDKPKKYEKAEFWEKRGKQKNHNNENNSSKIDYKKDEKNTNDWKKKKRDQDKKKTKEIRKVEIGKDDKSESRLDEWTDTDTDKIKKSN